MAIGQADLRPNAFTMVTTMVTVLTTLGAVLSAVVGVKITAAGLAVWAISGLVVVVWAPDDPNTS